MLHDILPFVNNILLAGLGRDAIKPNLKKQTWGDRAGPHAEFLFVAYHQIHQKVGQVEMNDALTLVALLQLVQLFSDSSSSSSDDDSSTAICSVM